VARPPSQDELLAAQLRGVDLEVTPVALDAFVFLVNNENPVEDLTLESVRGIYTGEITQWSELIRTVGEIHTYQRNRNSGSQELMEKLVMHGASMVESPDMILESMMGPINAISEDPLGIGYSVYFYAAFMYPHEMIKMIAIDGVLPTSTNIAARSYPLTTEVYAVIRSDTPQQSMSRLLLGWLLTDEGKEAIAASGYVPIHD
jgi:phosphate transport system substrate-binding protein